MKGRWLVLILGASLALNLAGFGAVAYHRLRAHSHQRRFYKTLREGAPERLKALYQEHEGRMLELREQYRDAQDSLFQLMTVEAEPDSAEVEKWLDRITGVRKEMHRLMFQSARKLNAEFPPEERERVHRSLRRMYGTGRPHGPRHGGWDAPPPGPPPGGPPPGMPDEDEPIEP